MPKDRDTALQHFPIHPQDKNPVAQTTHAAPQYLLRAILVADPTCPWCRIAFHRLARLVDDLPVRLSWHPFLLDPQLPPQGVPRRAYLERRYGGLGAGITALRHAARAGAQDGIRFAFDRIERQPDGRRAQALLLAAEEADLLIPTARRLLAAFFEEGRDLGDPMVIEEIALAARLPLDLIDAARGEQASATVREASRLAIASAVDGVPALLLPGLGMISGAQPTPVLRALLESALTIATKSSGWR